jgi:hypothetical protein
LLTRPSERRDEVASLERVEVDLGKRTWTLPRQKAKNMARGFVYLAVGSTG